jgi:CubicO group peptidase (beta-lactamase class C family)
VFLLFPALIFFLWVSTGLASQASLQAGIERVLEEEGLTGIAWSLVGENGEVSLGAAGMRDNAARTEFTIDTTFHVGSLTKSLLATGMLRLASTGAVELDSPVRRYLPNLPFDNPWAGESDVSVRHLLDHTSGLDDARLWQMFSERPGPDTLLAAAFPDSEALLRVRARPGTRFSYSNMGYTILGMIVESVTGDRYESYMDRQVLGPLGMRDSTFSFTTQEGGAADPKLAWGHVDDGTAYSAQAIFLRPAGQFTTSAGDLARFARFLMSDGVIGGQAFIDKALMRERGRPYGTEAANSGLAAGYALGLGRRDRHGVIGFCHGGNIVGFVAMMCIFPEDGKAFSYSVNTDSESADYGRIDRLFIEALAVSAAQAPPTAAPDPDLEQWHGRYILSPNRFETFSYLDTVFGAIEISDQDGSLTLTSLQQGPRTLRPVGSLVFSAGDRSTQSHVFLRGSSGEYLLSDGFRTYLKVPAAYLAAHWASVILGMAGFAWLFSAGLVNLLRRPVRIHRRTEAPAFIALLLLVTPLPFFMSQSFMALGDLTPASALLAAATLLLPLAMILTILRSWKNRLNSRLALVHGLAAVLALQWCAVLMNAGLLPLRLWI